MNLYTVLILATVFAKNNAKVKTYSTNDQEPIKDRLHKTAAELAKLIHLVRGYVDTEGSGLETDEELTEEKRASDLLPFDLDYFIVRNSQPNVRKKVNKQKVYQGSRELKQAKQKNPRQQHTGQWNRPHENGHWHKPKQVYSAPGAPNQANQDSGTRLHIFKNPKVLEMYKMKINKAKTKLNQHSGKNSDTRFDYQDSNKRRNAVFRLDSISIEDPRTPNVQDNNRLETKRVSESLEDFKEIDFGSIDDKRFEDTKRHDVDITEDDKRKKGREDDSLKQDNAWDVITKKYDWDAQRSNKDSPKSRNEHQKKKKTKFDDDWDKKVIKQNFDDRDKRTKPKINDDNNNKPKKDKNNKWDSVEIKPKKKKEINKWDRLETNSNKKKHFDDSYEKPQKERKKKNNDWDNVTVFKITAPKPTKKWKQESGASWDKGYAPKIVPYYNPKVKKARDSFDSSGFFGRTPIPYVGRQGIYVDNEN